MSETTALSRIAGAPISWGVCEVPGWGFQLDAERVLTDMQELGLAATEFGPEGFLPAAHDERNALLSGHGLSAVGGFLPVVVHTDHDPMPEVDAFIDDCLASGAGVVVLAVATGQDGYDTRPELSDVEWKTLLSNLDRIADRAAERGLVAVVHPHIGTLVENAEETQRVLDGSHIGLCIDTGHLVAAGADPVAITLANLSRVGHVHLKDVDAAVAARVQSGELAFSDAVSEGLWTVLGHGSVDVAAMISALEGHGYTGWYVLEQDLKLKTAPEGVGPKADVAQCLAYVKGALAV
ncbi:inosose dehydratase [Aeromicrobium sp. Root495]|uniref:TIM barrel protein n=1 Tax=Aeromicrobium sp. Root495 TaxID=1736550 RepID=UPI0006F5FC17|nr:TIM barrel protein [Aeromicrobium sp. Root495]KQY58721.1 inosose dehydratase [Aeromicrobium sp. Root495]